MAPLWGERRKRSIRVARSLFMVSSKAHSSATPSFCVSAIHFLCLFWPLGSSALHISTFYPPHRGMKAPKGAGSHRQGWQVNLKGGHNSNFTFQHLLFTGLSLRDPHLFLVSTFWESSHQKHDKDMECHRRLHFRWCTFSVKQKNKKTKQEQCKSWEQRNTCWQKEKCCV